MKTKLYLPVVAAFVMLNFSSCKKEGHGRNGFGNETSEITLNAAVSAGSTFKLNLATYGNSAASIIQQAGAFSISQITRDAAGNYIYEYQSSLDPKTGTGNTDKAIIRVLKTYSTQQGGNNCNNNGSYHSSTSSKNITINFTIE